MGRPPAIEPTAGDTAGIVTGKHNLTPAIAEKILMLSAFFSECGQSQHICFRMQQLRLRKTEKSLAAGFAKERGCDPGENLSIPSMRVWHCTNYGLCS